MASLVGSFLSWLRGGGAIAERVGQQSPVPGAQLVAGSSAIGVDGALQLSTVWACIDRRASTLASLPFFAYEASDGQRKLARGTRLFQLLHDSPNARMTPLEFWRAMLMNHDLRGAGYARIDRDERTGEALSLWPMPSDQVVPAVLDDGTMVYQYTVGSDIAVLHEDNVLVIKGLGNGTVGLSKLEFMRATTSEQAAAQTSASRIFGNGGKPTGVLMLDRILKPDQRDLLRRSFAGLAEGGTSRLYLLEADMKYQQLSISPEDQQLLETRRFGVEELCRWFDVPPVLVHHSNVTTWGSGIEQIVEGFAKFSIRPMAVSIEQAVTKRVLTPQQRATMSVEINLDALLRGSPKDRAEIYAKLTQNGIMDRNEARQLENWPRRAGADELTVQSNLVPLSMLGALATTGGRNAPSQDPVAQ